MQLLTVQAEEPTVFMDDHQGVLPFANVGKEHYSVNCVFKNICGKKTQ